MNTDENRSDEDNIARSQPLTSPIGVHPRSSAAWLSLVLLFGCAFSLLLPTGSRARTEPSSLQKPGEKLKDPQIVAEGAKLFAPSCGSAYCHGAGGIGGGAPRLRGKDLDPQYLFKTISNGVTGTAMVSFKDDLSEEQIWKLIAFIVSDSAVGARPAELPARPVTVAKAVSAASDTASPGTLAGSAQTGKAIFFDSSQPKSCQACHAFNSEGGAIGPDLSNIGSKSAKELFGSILTSRIIPGSRYAVVRIALKSGDIVTGIKKEEDDQVVRVYDIAELPAVLRSIQKSDITKTETVDWAVHKDNASYTIKQLLDLIALLKSSQSKAPVTLSDIL